MIDFLMDLYEDNNADESSDSEISHPSLFHKPKLDLNQDMRSVPDGPHAADFRDSTRTRPNHPKDAAVVQSILDCKINKDNPRGHEESCQTTYYNSLPRSSKEHSQGTVALEFAEAADPLN